MYFVRVTYYVVQDLSGSERSLDSALIRVLGVWGSNLMSSSARSATELTGQNNDITQRATCTPRCSSTLGY